MILTRPGHINPLTRDSRPDEIRPVVRVNIGRNSSSRNKMTKGRKKPLRRQITHNFYMDCLYGHADEYADIYFNPVSIAMFLLFDE